MSDESEFARYRLMYEDLKQRVARLSEYERLVEELKARVEKLGRHVEELAAQGAVTPKECEQCGEPFMGLEDQSRCPDCRNA